MDHGEVEPGTSKVNSARESMSRNTAGSAMSTGLPPRKYRSGAVDMTGQRHGRLVVVRKVGRTSYGHAVWECRCDCGASHEVSRRSLLHRVSPTRSCGCLHAELSRARLAAHRLAPTTHDAGRSPGSS